MAENTSDGAPRPNFDPMDEEALSASIVFENEDLLQRVKELEEVGAEWATVEKIDNEDDAKDLADYLSELNRASSLADDRRDKRKRPYDGLAKIVQRFFVDQAMAKLTVIKTPLTAKLNAYLDIVKEANKKVAAAALIEAQKLVDAAKTPDQVKTAAKALKEAQKGAKNAGLKTDFGSAAHQTSRWAFDVTDISRVPTKFLQVNEAAVMAVIQTGTVEKPVVIDGILVKRVSNATVKS